MTSPDYDRAGKPIPEATGSDSFFRPGANKSVARRVHELWLGGITRDVYVHFVNVDGSPRALSKRTYFNLGSCCYCLKLTNRNGECSCQVSFYPPLSSPPAH
jgi:hypothetical protein